MASLHVGLAQNNVKFDYFCSGDRCGWWAKARRIKVADRRLKVVSSGGVNGLVADSGLSVNISKLDHNVVVRKRSIDKEDAVSGKVDQWIRDSVQQIVNNIEEAPFFLHLYPEDDEGSSRSNNMKIVREKASANSWPNIKHRWERGSSIPNGIALIEELKIDEFGNEVNDNQHCSSTKVFGIVIQERGLSFPASYLLKTSRVRSISGICTHYSIFRADCFGETADVQLKKQWLL